MAKILGEEVKPPFANYDIVVYFGGGLFSIPLLLRYIVEPSGIHWPRFGVDLGSPFANEAVSTLSVLFSIYILGHIIAYAASQIVEKTVERFLGKISTAIILSSLSQPHRGNHAIRALIYDRIKIIKSNNIVIGSLFRALLHAPALPVYILTYAFGLFGYYDTRITTPVMEKARQNLKNIGLGDIPISIRSKWYKPLEYFVINRYPQAVGRMYNYLIISGLFRTVSLMFLCALWMNIIYVGIFMLKGAYNLQPILGLSISKSVLAEYSLLSVIYTFSLASYLKFQRRYAEEAIFAFVFCSDRGSKETEGD